MDDQRFDQLTRVLGAASSRRGALAALAGLGMGLGAGLGLGAARDAEAKRHRRRRRCDPACPAGQTCDRATRTCRCDNGGAVCGATCCLIGQECRGGECATLPEPGGCVGYGQACKDVGSPCCDGLACGSGQGGGPVACWVRKTGRCDSTAECVYGTECTNGVCVGLSPDPPVPPVPPAPTCDAATCPACPTASGLEPFLSPACEGDSCACACEAGTLPTKGGALIFSGVSCGTSAACGVSPAVCADILTMQECGPGSAHCCCFTFTSG